MIIKKANRLQGSIQIPGDKSISHRGVMFGAIAQGITRIQHFLEGADCLSTISCFQKMGIPIIRNGEEVIIEGKGLYGLSTPNGILDAGNSGTTTRLLSGILVGQQFSSELTGDASIQKRPMKRILTPLTQMGAHISSRFENGCAPLVIKPSNLNGIDYTSPVASAQVKSCILLAGLYADSPTTVTEPSSSRNHTELMLSSFGANLTTKGTSVTILPQPELLGQEIMVPGDISSAAYFIAGALLLPNSEVFLKNVGINPTRDGILRVCREMGGHIEYSNVRTIGGEQVADLLITSSSLKGIVIEGDIIPTLVDELPVIAVLAAFAKGTTIIRDAQELKVKESNRLDIIVAHLQKMGATVEATIDGMIIEGGRPLKGCQLESFEDHRIAMAFAIAGLVAEGETQILGGECVKISYPGFFETLQELQR